jgi:two-component system, chemotaxis family, response regulator WspF
VRIGIVNDMFMAVEAMRRAVASAKGLEVAWIARDGLQAVELCSRDKPDLVLMDLIMPNMDGVEATRQIMAETPCPIVVVTASIAENTSRVFEAMGAGALDAVNTPVLANPGNPAGAHSLLAKIETIRKLVGSREPRASATRPVPALSAAKDHPDRLVALGASAGGPVALARVLGHLSNPFPAGIVVVQHVDEQFAQGLADWLSGQTNLRVRLAVDGDRPEIGTVLLAGRNQHLVFANATTLAYTSRPVDCPYRPSVDVFFRSAARDWEGSITGVLLTGMGRDGAAGLKALRDRGHHTIAQDERSSAVYGMPRAARELDAAAEILALDKIAPRLTNICR